MISNLGLLFQARNNILDETALVLAPDTDEPLRLKYGELDERCMALASHLHSKFPAGTRIGVLGYNSGNYLIAMLASMRAGCVAVPLGPRQGAAMIASIAADAEPAAIFVDGDAKDLVPAGAHAISLDILTELPGNQFESTGSGQDIAIQMYTSGSTGRPKGVLLSHDAMLHNMKPMLARKPARARIVVVGAPLFHMNGLLSCLFTFALGSTVCLLEQFDPRRYLRAVSQNRATTLIGVPTMFSMMLEELVKDPSLDVTSVTGIFPSSAPLSDELLKRLQTAFPAAVVQNTYGTTEASGMFGPDPKGRRIPAGSVGVLQTDVEYKILDGPTPTEGRLLVRTPALMTGYFRNAEATADKLRDGWYDTGDLVRVVDGFFYIIGRADDMIICGGENIYPSQLESLLETHPSVRAAAVVALPDQRKSQVPVAFVVPKQGASIDPEDIKNFARTKGPPFAYPRFVAVVTQLPLMASRKVDKRTLSELAVMQFGATRAHDTA